jgi:hypothetical protein
MVLLCCNADGSEKLHPLIVRKFEKPYCLKGLKHYPCNCKSSKNAWVTEEHSWCGWSLFKGKWLAKTGKSFQYWISVLLTMTRALI